MFDGIESFQKVNKNTTSLVTITYLFYVTVFFRLNNLMRGSWNGFPESKLQSVDQFISPKKIIKSVIY